MKIEKLDTGTIVILEGDTVRLKEMGNVSEIMFSKYRSKGGYIRKISKDLYEDIRTGEVLPFKHIENRAQALDNVAKSLARGRELLNTNITDVTHCRWITVTYAENMTDPKRLYRDWVNCCKKLRRRYGHFEYIIAAEPQGRGAWHLHIVLIFEDKAPYMPNDVVAACWGQGFVTVKRLDDVDNVGAYLTAYLGDMEMTEENYNLCDGHFRDIKEVEYNDENGQKQTKRYLKGARLCLYPPGFHIFRCSKGIKEPVVSFVAYSEAKEKVGSGKPTFSKEFALKDDKSEFENSIKYEYYNKLREK